MSLEVKFVLGDSEVILQEAKIINLKPNTRIIFNANKNVNLTEESINSIRDFFKPAKVLFTTPEINFDIMEGEDED